MSSSVLLSDWLDEQHFDDDTLEQDHMLRFVQSGGPKMTSSKSSMADEPLDIACET